MKKKKALTMSPHVETLAAGLGVLSRSSVPTLACLVALGAIAVAGFALYIVWSVVMP